MNKKIFMGSFFEVGPKSYLYGGNVLNLAMEPHMYLYIPVPNTSISP